ncbi:MAG TPA: universal stress protein [Sphingomonas sp.]|nr:universal stress protein [Sphingomonas sp.]
MVATDLRSAGAHALQRACLIASQHCASLTILHVAGGLTKALDRALLAEDLDELAETQAALHPCIQSVTARLVLGGTANKIALEAKRANADLIAVGGHGRMRWANELFGTTVEKLVRRTILPVLVVREPAQHPYRRIVAAIDEGEIARETLELAATLSSADTLFAVHAFLPTLPQLISSHGDDMIVQDSEQRAIETMIGEVLGNRSDVVFVTHSIARRGEPIGVIVQAHEQFHADLVVAVTHGRSGLGLALRGSFADMLIEEAPFDLLLQHRR